MGNAASQRMERVQSPVIPIVGEWIRRNPGTLSLGQGVVHFRPPPAVIEAIAACLGGEGGLNHYGAYSGGDALLSKLSHKLQVENGVALNSQRIVFTAGSNMAFMNAVLTIADTDDEIVLLSPYYFNHHMAIEIAGCRPVVVPTNAEYQIDVQAIADRLTPRTKAVVTISPNNPTGAVYSREALTEVNQLCREHGCYHISDEAYEYFTFGQEAHFSPASLADSAEHTISLYSLSKAYGMAGWRCGYMLLPQHLETAVKKVQDTNLICPPQICQVAASAALDAGRPWCRMMVEQMRPVRSEVLSALSALGPRVRVPRSDGAFYALLQLETEWDDLQLVRQLIERFGVAVLPGSTFGVTGGCSLRVAFGALCPESVSEGLKRLVHGLSRLL